MGYELRTNVVEPVRNGFSYLTERFGDRPATRYQEASFNVQPMENFQYRPTWDADHELYDPNYSALKLTDPYGYTDPRQYYYTPYVANAADRHESFAQTLKYIEDRRLLDKLPENWHTVLTGFVLPLRHYEQGAQLISTNASRFGYGTTVTQAACFASFDRIGNAQLLSLIGLALASGAADTLTDAKKNWLYAPHLQGLRRMVEELLVEPDWAAGLIGLDLLDEQLYPLLYEHLDERSLFRNAAAYSLLARHFNDWYAGHRKWLNALIKAWTKDPQHSDANTKVLGEVVDRWYPRACGAVREFARGLADSAGSVSVAGAAERGVAELAASLTRAGIPVNAPEGVTA
ncbi:phenol 2-monooxygenase [Pseudonocardia asaccharolytica]|uniref:propane 2-monooxygenase n=1 Tax=Pseudonocardia asaccharolytica DSM 44247 = NBRC 16224 TaxID=1123024 RepID=A0A511D225_9PSEU|nr:phenol 2-monooxygenase [Pseudonocardia asaccharolytica]GEL18832.1 phenol hydroxylase P1 protein [Pseudonocardia asaccharolytica DSM 44247 = NBRC 16224]